MIAHVRYIVGLVLDLAAVQGYIKRNPIRAERIRTPMVDPREYRLFRAPEVFARLDAPDAQNTPLEALIALMGLSALRPGEAIGLRSADLDGKWLRVRTSDSDRHGRLGEGDGKEIEPIAPDACSGKGLAQRPRNEPWGLNIP